MQGKLVIKCHEMRMRCLGFGEYEHKCMNKAGTKWSPYWCERCHRLRMTHIDSQLKKIVNKFAKPEDFNPHSQEKGDVPVEDRPEGD